MTLFRPTEDDHKRLDEEIERTKLAEMEAQAKKTKERAESLRTFEDLSHRIENGEPWFDIPISTERKDKNKNKNKNIDKDREEKPLPVFPTYKYSKPGLHESVIVGGLPFFIGYDFESCELISVERIEENSRVLRPLNYEEYPYRPYEFVDVIELSEYVKRETIDSLYRKALGIVKLFNDQDYYKQSIIAVDLVWSYFQDKFGTTHYLGVTGDNDSGKSSIGNTFEAVAYRCVNMTSPSAPNIFRVLGTIDPGQCTLVLDEADKIDDDIDIMNILKTGYDYNKRVPKTNTNHYSQIRVSFPCIFLCHNPVFLSSR